MSVDKKTSTTPVVYGRFDSAIETLTRWDPGWAATCRKMTDNPWNSGVLPQKLVELISVGLNAGCTMLNPEWTRHHIRAALDAGATKVEILRFKMRFRLLDSQLQHGGADSSRRSSGGRSETGS